MDGETILTEGIEETPAAETVVETTEDIIVETVETEKPEEKPADKEVPETKETVTKPEEKPEEEKPESKEETEDNLEAAAEEDIGDKEKDTEIKDLAAKYEQAKGSAKNYKETAERLETVVKTIVESKLTEVPDEYKALIPEGDAVTQLDWLTKAESTGLFGKKSNPEVEIGRNLAVDKKQPESKKPLTPQQRLSNTFSSIYKK